MEATQADDVPDEETIIEIKPELTSKSATTSKPGLVTAQYGVQSPVPVAQPKPKKQKATEPEIDYSAIVVGATVKHKVFGEGIIAKLNDKHIYVEFKAGQKNFLFPDAFKQRFLKI